MIQISAEYDFENQASILYDAKGKPSLAHVRGGICFPTAIELQGNDIGGFILIAGRSLDDGVITIYEQLPFLTIENILAKDRSVNYTGISGFMNNGWSNYFNRIFYWKQPFALAKKYRLQVTRSKLIEPKPALVEVDWSTDEEAYLAVWHTLQTGRLVYKKNSEIHFALKRYQDTNEVEPAIHALQCVLIGLERFLG